MSGGALSGRWALARTGGVLPPLGAMHKRIAGGEGATHLGPLRLPFRIAAGPEGPELRYRGLLRPVTDRLRPGPGGGWSGETRVLGVRVGTFRMTPREPPS